MKKVFSVFLLINILFAVVMNAQSYRHQPVSPVMNPEKIILLSALVDCMVWGDFIEEHLPRVEAVLDQMGLPRSYRQVPSEMITRYWVHTEPFRNRQAAEREINKLRNLGIISHRVSEEGAWLNAISLGEFENRISAQKLLEQLKAKSETNAMILERKIERKKYLIFETDSQETAELKRLAGQFADSSLELSTCERL
ncbi:MAG: SPOR domain-containing protein [Nitrosomonas sp.]|nr:SPOR domain-containing protein [Nitrosomonas sp.]